MVLDDYRKKRDFTKSPESSKDAAPKRTKAGNSWLLSKH